MNETKYKIKQVAFAQQQSRAWGIHYGFSEGAPPFLPWQGCCCRRTSAHSLVRQSIPLQSPSRKWQQKLGGGKVILAGILAFGIAGEAKMNLKKMLCVAALVVLVILAASYTRVQALSLVNPTSGWTFYENVTTQIQWRRNNCDVAIGVIMVADIHSGATGSHGDQALKSV